ncbi:MAG: DUF4911 domain-containing protein [Thermotogae bacterium]|nr:DUF4911 domain-containing protein [Thermotogota bacterium]MCP5465479.1 DUF4911 domain-containing protein [Thermotogota bacterium]
MLKNGSENRNEYDIYIDMKQEEIHMITYLLEAEDNIMSIRKRFEDGLLKIIVPEGTKDDALILINSLKEYVELEVVKVEPHNGTV